MFKDIYRMFLEWGDGLSIIGHRRPSLILFSNQEFKKYLYSLYTVVLVI